MHGATSASVKSCKLFKQIYQTKTATAIIFWVYVLVLTNFFSSGPPWQKKESTVLQFFNKKNGG
jgi:hypothetical protein